MVEQTNIGSDSPLLARPNSAPIGLCTEIVHLWVLAVAFGMFGGNACSEICTLWMESCSNDWNGLMLRKDDYETGGSQTEGKPILTLDMKAGTQ